MNYNKKDMKIAKKILLIFGIIVTSIVLFFGIVFCYYEYCYPQLMKEFRTYNGINFDYTFEENNYEDKYHYKQLNEDEAIYYRLMYHAASNDEMEYIFLFDFDTNKEFKARNAFANDFPEYYWFSQNINVKDEYAKDKLGIFEYRYFNCIAECYDMDQEDIKENNNKIEQLLDDILPELKGEDDYSTVYNVYRFLIDNVSYDLSYIEYNDIRSTLFYQKGVCASYAETFQLLCNRLGIECYSVFGESTFNDAIGVDKTVDSLVPIENIEDADESKDLSHEWNIVKINGTWYWVDVTWADDKYIDQNNNTIGFDNDVFFLSPDDLFLTNHIPSPMFTYDRCNDYSMLYLENNGMYLDSYDESLIEDAVLDAIGNHSNHIIIETNNEDDTNQVLNWLQDSKFFDLYHNYVSTYYSGTIYYFPCDKYSYYVFWNVTNL